MFLKSVGSMNWYSKVQQQKLWYWAGCWNSLHREVGWAGHAYDAVFTWAGNFITYWSALSCCRDSFVVHGYKNKPMNIHHTQIEVGSVESYNTKLPHSSEHQQKWLKSLLLVKFRSTKPCKTCQHVGSCTCKALACLPGHRVQLRGWPMLN